jgi:hypothetical protein
LQVSSQTDAVNVNVILKLFVCCSASFRRFWIVKYGMKEEEFDGGVPYFSVKW